MCDLISSCCIISYLRLRCYTISHTQSPVFIMIENCPPTPLLLFLPTTANRRAIFHTRYVFFHGIYEGNVMEQRYPVQLVLFPRPKDKDGKKRES